MKILASILTITALAGSVFADTVNSVTLSKEIRLIQNSANKFGLVPGATSLYEFSAEVNGDDLDALEALDPAPRIQLPGNSKFRKIVKREPMLGFGFGDRNCWKFGRAGSSEFSNWRTKSKAVFDALFPNGNYVFTVQGKTINLSLPRDSYPVPPKLKLSGGRWNGGIYEIKQGRPLTIKTNVFEGYGTHLNDLIILEFIDAISTTAVYSHSQASRKMIGGPPVSRLKSHQIVIPADKLDFTHFYYIRCKFSAVVSYSTALPGVLATADNSVDTWITVSVKKPW